MLTIYHNPRCRKSRETLAIINDNGGNVEIVEYLKETPSVKDLKLILQKLDLSAKDIIRTGETLFKEEYKGLNFSEDEWLQVLHENPILIERPIVIRGNKGVIGRPPENVLELL